MSKRKNKPAASPSPANASPTSARTTQVKRVAPRPAPEGIGRSTWIIGLVVLVLLVSGGLLYWQRSPQPSAGSNAIVTPVNHIAHSLGRVNACRTLPAFVTPLGFNRTAAISTDVRPQKGAVLVEQGTNGQTGRTYQHPSWAMAGYLGPPATDHAGNIYLFPAPWINLIDNPPEKQNILYKIDGQTGVMAEFLRLPAAAKILPENPYGILGLAYDCDTNSLYVASVSGSTRAQENGRIFQIDLATAKVVAQMEKMDVFGLAGFNGTKGKRLYFGMARTPDVRSIQLDDDGHFVGEPRQEFSLEGLGAHGDEKAQRITIDEKNILTVRSLEFDFNLIAPTELRRTLFKYGYDTNKDAWHLVDSVPIK